MQRGGDDASPDLRRSVGLFLSAHDLPLGPERDCPYLPERIEQSEGFYVTSLSPAVYLAFMDRGFRRNGKVVYRTACPSCRACTPLRVPVSTFQPTPSQRRVWRRNRDLRVTVAPPEPTDEKWHMYRAYLEAQHDGTMSGSREEFEQFLYASPVESVEFCFHAGETLVGVSIADRCPGALSSVYMVFAPQERRRSLGTYSVLWELDYCARQGIDYYYFGYYVPGARTMAYKARFGPHELLHRGPEGAAVWSAATDDTR